MVWLLLGCVVGAVVLAGVVGGACEIVADWSAAREAKRRREIMRLLEQQDGFDCSAKPTSAIHQLF